MKKTVFVLMVAITVFLLIGTASADTWICENCQTENTGLFCGNCGAKMPEAQPEPMPESNEWGCPDCYHLNTTNFCSNCGRKKPTPEETAGLRVITVPENVYETMDVEGVFVGETLIIPEEEAVVCPGSISDANKEDTYSFTAPRDGRYRFDLEDTMADTSLRLRVWDSKNKNLIDTYSNGSYEVLTGGETYAIRIEQHRGSTQYTLKIGIQKPTIDISRVTTVYDQVSFADQKNVYMFTAPIAGRYRFDLTEANANTKFRLMMWDKLQKNILDTYAGNAYVVLDAGETYELQVRQHNNLGSYVMLIYFQKETRDISGYDTVNDSVQYNDQKNEYKFTPTVSGRYRFDLTESNVNTKYRLMIWDKYEKNMLDTYSGGGYVILDAGEPYTIQVRQHQGTDTYKMLIGYQKESTDISGTDIIYDRITYDDQKNVYFFTPRQSGKYEILLSNFNSGCKFRLMAWDKYEKNLLDTYRDGTVMLEANETYEIQVRQHNGHDSYRMMIRLQ